MFVQIIEGRTNDPASIRREMDRWNEELRPGATGFLGSTGGVTDDGRLVVFARFESAAAAEANSNRPEQGEWWSAVERCLEGEASFADSEDTEELFGGGSDDAGFVQVMKVQGVDREAVARLDEKFQELAATMRPDVIGGLRVWVGPDTAYDVTYFTSEADARAAEAGGPPAEMGEVMEDYERIIEATDFLDLSDPWLT